MCTSFSSRRKENFRIFRESKVVILPKTKILSDACYRRMQKIHKNLALPYKKTKKTPLSKEQKKENRSLSSQRVIVENTIGLFKRFKIIFDMYRKRRRRFGLRFNLIAAIDSFELLLEV